MANEKGTGKHGHKDTKEPWPHHEGQSKSGSHAGGSSRSSASGGSHSSSGSHSSGGSHPSSGSHASGSGSHGASSQRGGESSDLKSREYRDKDGNIHHHTHTAGKSK